MRMQADFHTGCRIRVSLRASRLSVLHYSRSTPVCRTCWRVLESGCDLFSYRRHQLKLFNANSVLVDLFSAYRTCQYGGNLFRHFGRFCKFWELLTSVSVLALCMPALSPCRTSPLTGLVYGDFLLRMCPAFGTVLAYCLGNIHTVSLSACNLSIECAFVNGWPAQNIIHDNPYLNLGITANTLNGLL